jgi:beta-galactosidase
MMDRRTFLKSATAVAAIASSPRAALASVLGQLNDHRDLKTLEAGWEFYRGPLDGRYQVWHSEELVTWEPVTVPHCFNHYDACDPDTPAYRGQGWYRTTVQAANPYAEGRTLLHMDGAGQRAEVWVGETRVAEHTGGYDEWFVDLTEQCRSGPAGQPLRLAVLCDNGRDIERMPSDQSDFTIYGGLYRPVHLVYAPAVSLEAVHTHVAFEPGQSAEIAISARLYAPQIADSSIALDMTVLDPAGKVVHTARLSRNVWQGETELAKFTLREPKLWSPAQPHLYTCQVSVRQGEAAATSSHRFGVRHTRFEDHGPFYLNGQRLLLRGTQRHEDHAGCAAAMPADLIREEMQLVREMGANIIRLGHYQQRRLVLELCDELGLFVWEELAWCRSGVVSDKFRQLGKTMLRTLIDQHRNHPSVLLWGLGNEDDWPTEIEASNHEAIRQYMTELRDLAHAEDPTRLTGYRRAEFAKDIPDVYSPSIWSGWYSGVYTDYAATLEKARATVPHLLHVEWGADSHAGRYEEEPAAPSVTGKKIARGAHDGIWSETYACDLFEWYLRTIDATPWLAGALQWVFKDFTTPLRVENPVPRVNQKGLLARDMTKKEGYFVFQSWWAAKPMIHLFGQRRPVRWGAPGQQRLVRVYANCAEAELFVNGKSAGTRRRDVSDFPCAGLRWSVAFVSGPNELRVVGRWKNGRELADTLSFRYETRMWKEPAQLSLAVARQSSAAVTVEAELLDAAGVRCLDSCATVRFGFAGDGRMIDNQGTSTGSRVVQLCNGRAEISVHVETAGIVSVSTPGISPAFLKIAGERTS